MAPPAPIPIPISTKVPTDATLTQIIARLCALNSTDPTIIALLTQYQQAAGVPLQ
jgi:hypothetical protein